jgi:hypothetical protein
MLAILAVGASLGVPRVVAADDRDESIHAHYIDMIARGALAPTGALDVSSSIAWRIDRRFALGAVVGFTFPAESHNDVYFPGVFNEERTTFWRVTPHARWDFHSARFTRAWLGAEVGPQIAVERGRGPDPRGRNTHYVWGLFAAGELGFAIHAVAAFSFGPSIVVGGAPFQDFPFSLATLLSIGFNVGVHVGM